MSSSIITRPLPNAVKYDLTSHHQTTITLPVHSTWTSGLHWHEAHTEYLSVIRGSIWVRLDNEIIILKAGQTATVEKFARHEWRRADVGTESDGEEVVVVERTDPADGEKSVFFWCLNGVILDVMGRKNGGWILGWIREWELMFKLWLVFGVLDNWPVFAELDSGREPKGSSLKGVRRGLEWAVTHLILGLAAFAGWVFGLHAIDQKFLPDEIAREWNEKGKTKAK